MKNVAHFREVSASKVGELWSKNKDELHSKIDSTRDAYFGFIFPVDAADVDKLSAIFGFSAEVGASLTHAARDHSTFRRNRNGEGQLTNHITGAFLLLMRGKTLDTGLSAVTDNTLRSLVEKNIDTVFAIAEARASWFGRIYFPSIAFANAISVFGGKVSAGAFYDLAESYGQSASAGARQTVKGDFGIAVWLTLLGRA
jgi:hypothetical protein